MKNSFFFAWLPWFCLLLLGAPGRGQPLVWPGTRMARIEGKKVVAYVPWKRRLALRALAAEADRIYLAMCRDADFHPKEKLPILFGDWTDNHNGYSFVVPFPLVEVDLALPRGASTIFDGYRPLERTLVHELAHQISNDRNYGFRAQLERIFGRVLPMDGLSALVWLFSTPAHQTMPRFWLEGLAVWAETAYADPKSPWAGRGRDPLVHMVWRLDAAAGKIPRARDWRITWHLWPFGNQAYLYGAAYTRYLAAVLGTRKKMWRLVDLQARQQPFFFDGAPLPLLGATHEKLIARARAALLQEEEEALRVLRKVPPTHMERLTPPDTLLGAPAWLPGGRLAYMARPIHGRPRLHILYPDGRIQVKSETGHQLGNLRSPAPGLLVWAEYDWRSISWVHLGSWVLGRRLLQPDFLPRGDKKGLLVAIRYTETGSTRLVLLRLDRRNRMVLEKKSLPTRGTAWSPAFRPAGPGREAQLAWVETFEEGSRLVLAPLSDPKKRRVLLERRGRILHPVWAGGGKEIYFCSDATGVADAYRLTLGPGERVENVLPVTHTLGGVIACVPSPDGKTLAVLDHDEKGPFLSKIPCDPSIWPKKLPVIRPAWPARLFPGNALARKTKPPTKPSAPEPVPWEEKKLDLGAYKPEPYRGLKEFRPLFWTPTTLPVPEGGIGISGLGADPLFTHIGVMGAGLGPVERKPVGYLGYAYLGAPIEIGGNLWQSERTFQDQVVDDRGHDYDYTETVDTIEFRAGRGLAGLERTFLGYVSFGIAGHHRVSSAARDYRGANIVSTPPFRGTERYVQVTLGYADAVFFPQSYAPGDGVTAALEFRHSGLGGSLRRNRLFLNSTWALDLPGRGGVQVVLGGQAGWSDGDRTLQGNFVVGGPLGRGLPRGYVRDTEAVGRHLLAGSLACRVPLWRPFRGFSTTPFRFRQLVLEVFGDSAKVSTNHFAGNGDWYSSVGGEIHAGWEFRSVILSPGLGIAKQLDGDRDWQAWIAMGFRF